MACYREIYEEKKNAIVQSSLDNIRLEAFTATKYNKILPVFQPRQVVKSR
jgi:hypothetical protein